MDVRRSPAEVLVGEAMHAGIMFCPPETPLRDVARTMAEHRVHCVAVQTTLEESYRLGRLWAIISDLDLVGAASLDLDSRTAGGAAASPVVTVTPGETVERAAQLMREYGTAHLVVVDAADGRPIGIISTLDVAAVLAGTPRSASR